MSNLLNERLWAIGDLAVKAMLPFLIGYLAWQIRWCQAEILAFRRRCVEVEKKLQDLNCELQSAARVRASLAEEIKVTRTSLIGKELVERAESLPMLPSDDQKLD